MPADLPAITYFKLLRNGLQCKVILYNRNVQYFMNITKKFDTALSFKYALIFQYSCVVRDKKFFVYTSDQDASSRVKPQHRAFRRFSRREWGAPKGRRT